MLRLKEVFSHVSQDKQRLAEENRQLRALLAQNGLGTGSVAGGSSVMDDSMSNPSVGYSPSTSMGSYPPASSNTSALTPPPLSASSGGRGGGISPHSATYPPHTYQQSGHGNPNGGASTSGPANQNPALDYEQFGIDFVLT